VNGCSLAISLVAVTPRRKTPTIAESLGERGRNSPFYQPHLKMVDGGCRGVSAIQLWTGGASTPFHFQLKKPVRCRKVGEA